MYLRTIQRHNKDGSTVRYVQLAHNHRDEHTGLARAQVLYSSAARRTGPRRAGPPRGQYLALPAGRGSAGQPGGGERAGSSSRQPHLWRGLVRGGAVRQLGMGRAIEQALAERDFRTPVERAIFAMVANRCLAPASKLGVERWVAEEVALRRGAGARAAVVPRHGRPARSRRGIAQQVFFEVANLLNLEVDLLFFDTTSTYFEIEEEDDLRRRGHSKDSRGDLPQVVIGLAVTREGIPVRCWVWPATPPTRAW